MSFSYLNVETIGKFKNIFFIKTEKNTSPDQMQFLFSFGQFLLPKCRNSRKMIKYIILSNRKKIKSPAKEFP